MVEHTRPVSGSARSRANRSFTSPTSSSRAAQPRLANKKEIIRAKTPECTLEAQDFRRNDTELIYTCYRSPFADVFGIDLASGKVTVYRKVSGEYNEVEGIFPDGEYTLVESSREQVEQNSYYIDIWKLKLEPDSKDFTRVTRWGEYPRLQGVEPRRQRRRPPDRVSIGAQPGPGRRRLRHLHA